MTQLSLASRRLALRALAGLFLVLGVGGCGGGGGNDVAGVGTGGTGTISNTVSVGPISGFGSVIVSGLRYDDSAAAVTDEDGNSRSRQDLKLGMVVAVSGSADFVAGTGVATGLRIGSELVGPVSAIDLATGRLVVLGATVSVKGATVFDESLQSGLSALHVGDMVEVYGFYNAADGGITASRIELKPLATRYSLRAPVQSLNTASHSFMLAGALIDYSGVPTAQQAALADGAIVKASSARLPLAGVWHVDSIAGATRVVLGSGETKIEGNIARLDSATSFVVDGIRVDAGSASIAGSLTLGARVKVEGRASNGVLIAKEVEASSEDEGEAEEFELTALITDFNATTQRFRLHGQLIDASGPVSFENGTRANLANGRRIELDGYFDAPSGAVVATKINFED